MVHVILRNTKRIYIVGRKCIMPRPKGSKNKVKAIKGHSAADYAAALAEKNAEMEQLNGEIADINGQITELKAQLKSKKSAVKSLEKVVAKLEAQRHQSACDGTAGFSHAHAAAKEGTQPVGGFCIQMELFAAAAQNRLRAVAACLVQCNCALCI